MIIIDTKTESEDRKAMFGECRRSGGMLRCDGPESKNPLSKGRKDQACVAFLFQTLLLTEKVSKSMFSS